MSKSRDRSPLSWLRALHTGYDGKERPMLEVAPLLFRVALTICAGLIVCVGWYFSDRLENYRVGSPSPRTYLAQSSTRYVDRAATSDVRAQAADQIVNVRVRKDDETKLVTDRIDALKHSEDLGFVSAELMQMIYELSDDVRARVLDETVKIAERAYDKSVSRTEQTALIWESLRAVDLPQSDKNIIFQILDALLEPTVQDDSEMTSRLRQEISGQIPTVVRAVRVGSIIVEQGRIVTPAIAETLRSQGYPDATIPWKNLAFIVTLTFFWCMWITWIGTKQETKLTNREWAFIAVVLVLDWIAQRAFALWDMDSLSVLVTAGWLFLTLPVPFAFQVSLGGCLIGYLLAFPGMTSQIAVGCVICGITSGASFLMVNEASSRIMIWRNIFGLGIWVSASALFIRWGFGLALTWHMFAAYLVLNALWSSLVVAVLPLWETVFGMISPLRLLEMSHPSQPLLKRLQLQAPGTYHHTATVATLAEAAAEKLGLNALLVKTGAYYHDIGKLKRPHYFVENQSFGDNVHDRLDPEKSVRFILAHVEDGLKLADENKLPQAIKDFIIEHHGTTFQTYFYQKAVNKDKENGGDGSSIDKSAFGYKGPTPQRPETALLMLADSIDAAIRSGKVQLNDRPDYEKFVTDIIESKVGAGQFVDVDFTFKEMKAIKRAFVDVLLGMYHTREITPIDTEEAQPQPTEQSA